MATSYLRGLESAVRVQDPRGDVHQRSVSLVQAEVGDVLAEVVPGQDHDGDLLLLQGVLHLLVALLVLWSHHQESGLPETGDVTALVVIIIVTEMDHKVSTSSQK